MAGHVLRLQRERPAHTAMYWVPEDGRRKIGRPKPAGSPVTVIDGDFSSPDAPRGTGRPKSN